MEQTPRSNNLYREIAKDFQPKQAAMNICKYIQQMAAEFTRQIEELENEVEKLKRAKSLAQAAIPQPKARSTDITEPVGRKGTTTVE